MEGVSRRDFRAVSRLFGKQYVKDKEEFLRRAAQREALRRVLLCHRAYYQDKSSGTIMTKLRNARAEADPLPEVLGGGTKYVQDDGDFDDGEFPYDGRLDWCHDVPYDEETKSVDVCVTNCTVVELPPFVSGDPCSDEFLDSVGDALYKLEEDKEKREDRYREEAESSGNRYYGPTNDEKTWAFFFGNDREGNNVVCRVPFGPSFKIQISNTSVCRDVGFAPALARWMESRGNCLPNTVKVRLFNAPGTRGYKRNPSAPGKPAAQKFATVHFPNTAARDKAEKSLSFMQKKGATIFLRVPVENYAYERGGVKRQRFRTVKLQPLLEEMRVGADRLAMEKYGMTYHKWFTFKGVHKCENVRNHVRAEFKTAPGCVFKVEPLDEETLAPMLADSFDIEAASSRGSKFMCDPNLPGDAAFMICHNLSWKNSIPPKFKEMYPDYKLGTSFMRVCQTIVPCDALAECIVDISSNECDMLNRYRDLIAVHWRVDAIDGWNIFRFDNMYMGKRAELVGAMRFLYISPIISQQLLLVEKNLSTNAVGSNSLNLLYRFRVRMDGFQWDKANTKRVLGSGLDNVLKEEMGVSGKLGVSPADMNWVYATKNAEGNAIVAAYCVRDTRSKDLLEMLGYMDQAIQQSTMTFTPEDMLVVSGQQEKIMSYLLRTSHVEGYVVTGMNDNSYASSGYAGGLVINPNPGQHRCCGWTLYKPEEVQFREVLHDCVERYKRLLERYHKEHVASRTIKKTKRGATKRKRDTATKEKKAKKRHVEATGRGDDGADSDDGDDTAKGAEKVSRASSRTRRVFNTKDEEGESIVDDMEPMTLDEAIEEIRRLLQQQGMTRREALRMTMRAREKLNGCLGTEDFASLYPSLAREHNICFTTYVAPELVEDYRRAGEPVKGIVGSIGTHFFIQHIPEKVPIKEGRARAMMGMEDTGVYDERGIKMYTRRVEREGDDWFQYNDLEPHIKNRGFEGLIPKMERTLMKQRKFAKKMMFAASQKGDKVLEQMWNCRQLAIKVIMNSIYGFTGVTEGRYPFVPVADAITAMGSRSLKACVKYIEETYNGVVSEKNPSGIKAVVVYGDTDSVMVKVCGVDPMTAYRFLKTLENELTALFGDAMAMEFEDMYVAFTPQKSKMYSGLRFADLSEEIVECFMRGERKMFFKGKMRDILQVKIKGLKPVRRDNARVVREIIKAVLNTLYDEDGGGLGKALRVLQEELGPLIRDEVPLEDYVTTKSLKNDGEYAHINTQTRKKCYPPEQLPVVWGIEREALGYTPSPGDRVQIVIAKEADPKRLIPPPGRVGSTGFRTDYEMKKDDFTKEMTYPVCMVTRSPEELRYRGETLDREWYITHQLMNPLLTILFSAKSTVKSIMRRAIDEIRMFDRFKARGDARSAMEVGLGMKPILEFKRKKFFVLDNADETLRASMNHVGRNLFGETWDTRFEKPKSNKGATKGGAAEKKRKLEKRKRAEKEAGRSDIGSFMKLIHGGGKKKK